MVTLNRICIYIGVIFFASLIANCDSEDTKADIDLSKTDSRSGAAVQTANIASAAVFSEWPQWRGPNRDGISLETGWRKDWLENPPNVIWRKPIGEGFSGISIVNGKIYTMFAEGNDEFAVCLDADTGREIWRKKTGENFSDWQGGDGPRSTPLIDGNIAYFLSGYGKLLARDTETGNEIWSSDLQKEFGAKPPQWGFSCSPLIDGNALYIEGGGNPGSALIAYQKTTGDVLWASQTDKTGYSSPISVTVNGIHQIIFFTGTKIISVSPSQGTLFWSKEWRTSYDINAATPVFISPNKLFISSGYDVGSALYEMTVTNGEVSADQIWKSRRMKNRMNTSVFFEGYIYGFDTKFLRCIDAQNGEEKWAARGFGEGTLVLSDGHIIALNEKGTLVLAEANPDQFTQIVSIKLMNGKCWTVPTLSGGKLFVRNESEIVSLDISGK